VHNRSDWVLLDIINKTNAKSFNHSIYEQTHSNRAWNIFNFAALGVLWDSVFLYFAMFPTAVLSALWFSILLCLRVVFLRMYASWYVSMSHKRFLYRDDFPINKIEHVKQSLQEHELQQISWKLQTRFDWFCSLGIFKECHVPNVL
jgi:hypothetical protein